MINPAIESGTEDYSENVIRFPGVVERRKRTAATVDPPTAISSTTDVPIAEATPELITEIRAVAQAASEETFEDGMHNSVSRAVSQLVPLHGPAFIDALSNMRIAGALSAIFLAENLLWLGHLEHHPTHESRFWFFVLSFQDESAQVRSAAANALEALEDRRAAKYLRQQAEAEPVERLSQRMRAIANELEQIVPQPGRSAS